VASCASPADHSGLAVSDCSTSEAESEDSRCIELARFHGWYGNQRRPRVKPITDDRDTMLFRRFVCRAAVVVAIFVHATSRGEDETVPPQPMPMETASGTTLVELVALAETSSPNLRQAAAEVEATRGKAYQAGLYPNPVASGGATQLAGRESQYFYGMSQEIVTKHKLHLDQAAACREVFQAEQNFVKTRFALLTAVRQGYIVTLAAQRRTEVLGRLVEISTKSQQAAERLQRAGEGTRSDTLLFEIEVEKAEVGLENAETKWSVP
jgi:hypothetical protein